MDDKVGTELRFVRTGSALIRGSARSGMVARGRRDAIVVAPSTNYERGVLEYRAGNFAEAVRSFRQAAEQGHAESQYLLSTMLENGEGTREDQTEAAIWERRAAEQNHTYAQANVSFRGYTAGDFPQAFDWCARAAKSGLAWAQFNLGLMYRKGEGVGQDDAEAAHWYRLAADQQFAEAQQKLGELYSLGLGVVQNYTVAAGWYRRAADQGHAEAQYQLAQLYQVGQGVEADYVEARRLIRLAALQGHAQAQREWKQREYRDA